jgi:hypothetical protein
MTILLPEEYRSRAAKTGGSFLAARFNRSPQFSLLENRRGIGFNRTLI